MKIGLSLALAIVAAVALILAAVNAFSEVVRPAPEFALAGGKSVRQFRGQPVVIVVAASAKASLFRKEVAALEKVYQEFASRGAIFVAAFTAPEPGEILSRIPFVAAKDGERVARACGIEGKFGVAVIGRDGNLDLVTAKFAGAYKVRDAILNNAQQQYSERTGL